MDIDAAFNNLTSQANKIINQASTSIEDAFNALLTSSEVEDIPKTQPSQAIAFSEPVEGVNSQDPEDLADSISESFGLSFIADEEDEGLPSEKEWSPSDYEECGECGFDHGYEPLEAEMAHAQIRELNFD